MKEQPIKRVRLWGVFYARDGGGAAMRGRIVCETSKGQALLFDNLFAAQQRGALFGRDAFVAEVVLVRAPKKRKAAK